MRPRRLSRAVILACLAMLAAGLGSLAGGAASAAKPAPFARIPQVRGRLEPSTERATGYTWPTAQRARWGAVLGADRRVRRVFYPLGGADVSSAIAMFTGPGGGPDEIVLSDVERFGTPASVSGGFRIPSMRRAYFDDKRGHAYSFFSQIGKLGRASGLGPAVLWELEELGATGVKIEYLDEEGARRILPRQQADAERDVLRRYDRRVWTSLDANTKPSLKPGKRDVVRLSFTLDGKPRRVLYVQHNVLDPDVPPVLGRALDRGFDAVLEKAAAHAQREPAYLAMRARALAGVARRGGIFVPDQRQDLPGLRAAGSIPEFGWHNRGGPGAAKDETPYYRVLAAPPVSVPAAP